jgi:mono/diheme cytochrome c family protein
MIKYFLMSALAAFALVSRAEETTTNLTPPAATAGTPADPSAGRALFLKNCAHCHGASAHGDDGPDLHNLDWTDAQIDKRIRTGKKGQMTSFEGKLTTDQITTIIAYLRTLK